MEQQGCQVQMHVFGANSGGGAGGGGRPPIGCEKMRVHAVYRCETGPKYKKETRKQVSFEFLSLPD
jgi:hypothetical protein